MVEQLNRRLHAWLAERELGETAVELINLGVMLLLVILVALVVYWIAKRIVVRIIGRAVKRTKNHWDDALAEHGVFRWAAHIAPAVAIYLMADVAFVDAEAAFLISSVKAKAFANIYLLAAVFLAVDSLLSASLYIYQTYEISRQRPIKFYVQVVKIVLYIAGGVLILSILLDKSPGYFFAGLGTLTAVLMLVFKDAILGFVAGIQIVANDLVRRGDWIEMPQHGTDGDVIDIALTTVKVQNWDKTVTTIPTHAMISESFKNWRGMSESGGRRIKRSILIDMSSICFCTEEMLERFSRVHLLADHIARKREEVAKHNKKHNVSDAELVNGRRLTNIGTFRAYIEAYLTNHPKIHNKMTFLVRQLAPGHHGLPLEIYVFSNDQVWANYEAIQSDIFDHLLAAVSEFDLRVYQHPSGSDLQQPVQALLGQARQGPV